MNPTMMFVVGGPCVGTVFLAGLLALDTAGVGHRRPARQQHVESQRAALPAGGAR